MEYKRKEEVEKAYQEFKKGLTEEKKKELLSYNYSKEKGLIVTCFGDWFIRRVDYPYDVKEHYLVINDLFTNYEAGLPYSTDIGLFRLLEKYSREGFTILINPQEKQNVESVFHIHLIKE